MNGRHLAVRKHVHVAGGLRARLAAAALKADANTDSGRQIGARGHRPSSRGYNAAAGAAVGTEARM